MKNKDNSDVERKKIFLDENEHSVEDLDSETDSIQLLGCLFELGTC